MPRRKRSNSDVDHKVNSFKNKKWATATKYQIEEKQLDSCKYVKGDKHAEQNLLLKVFNMMVFESLSNATVHIAGTKPPCACCQRVLKWFNQAIVAVDNGENTFDIHIDYIHESGQPMSDVDEKFYLELPENTSHMGCNKFAKLYNAFRKNEIVFGNVYPLK